MDGVREWIMTVLGVITVGAIGEMIILEGELKKYIKVVLGFVLIFTVLKPIVGLSFDELEMDFFEDKGGDFFEIAKKSEELQNEQISILYEEKLSNELGQILKEEFDEEISVLVETDKTEEGIGDIKNVKIEVFLKEGEVKNLESIKKEAAKKLDVAPQKISVDLREKR